MWRTSAPIRSRAPCCRFWPGYPDALATWEKRGSDLLTHRLKNPLKSQRPPMVAFYSALSGETDLSHDRPHLHLAVAEVEAVLHDPGFAAPGLLRPGTGSRVWSSQTLANAPHFAALASQLEAANGVAGISQGSTALCDDILQAVGVSPVAEFVNLAGKTTLAQALSV
jgi:heptosyltransferase-2